MSMLDWSYDRTANSQQDREKICPFPSPSCLTHAKPVLQEHSYIDSHGKLVISEYSHEKAQSGKQE